MADTMRMIDYVLIALLAYQVARLWPVPGLKGTYRDRTPVMALGLTDRVLTVGDILRTPLIPAAA